MITQVVPFPKDAAIPVVGRYQASLKTSAPDAQPGFVSLEGYLVGRLVAETLRRTPEDPTREAFLDAIAKSGFDFGRGEADFVEAGAGFDWR